MQKMTLLYCFILLGISVPFSACSKETEESLKTDFSKKSELRIRRRPQRPVPSENYRYYGKVVTFDAVANQKKSIVNMNYAVGDFGGFLRYTSREMNVLCRNSRLRTGIEGRFGYNRGDSVILCLGGQAIDIFEAKSEVELKQNTKILKNAKRLLLSTQANSRQNGVLKVSSKEYRYSLNFNMDVDVYEKKLAKLMLKYSELPAQIMQPSYGINLQTVQNEADNISGSIPFVDIFRTARPFKESLSEEDLNRVTFDEQGWPISIPDDIDIYTTIFNGINNAETIPLGDYHVIYDGVGELTYTHMASLKHRYNGFDIIEVKAPYYDGERATVHIKSSSAADPIRNIRIVMPGGTCRGNAFVRAADASECPRGRYRSFASQLARNRNKIIFNPDYLWFLRNFRLLRSTFMMNTSHHPPEECFDGQHRVLRECMTKMRSWDDRPKVEDAAWGGSWRTSIYERKGIPLEVLIALYNELNVTPWFSMPHNADDEYMKKYAQLVHQKLRNYRGKIHIEYGNEMWNKHFWGALFVIEKGLEEEVDGESGDPYISGLKYYAQRSKEVFQIWEEEFGSTNSLYRIVESYQRSTKYTQDLLSLPGFVRYVDGLAIAPYFYGCSGRSGLWQCQNSDVVEKTYQDVESVDDVFEMLDHQRDPYAIKQITKVIGEQYYICLKYGVDLIASEGGQALTVKWADQNMTAEKKQQLKNIFQQANRDPRMAERYTKFLNKWKKIGAAEFTLYTSPQGFHRWGNWGIAEHINASRAKSPKLNSIMNLQEEEPCWWHHCQEQY